jgi:FkbM family methyltransferase
MGYRGAIIRGYFKNTRSVRDWPACAVLAVGVAALKPGKHHSTWASRLLPKSVSVRFKRFGNVPVSINPADWTHHAVLREFIFENSYDLERVPFVPGHIIDCGAHIGLFLRLCRHRYPAVPITAFEPQINNSSLADRVAPAALLTLHQAAIGTEDGTILFDDDALNGFGFIAKNANANSAGTHPVPLISLPRILSTGRDRLLLKIDIEGGERELIPRIADLLPATCALFLETHHGEAGWQAASSLLTRVGFTVEKLRATGDFIDGFFVRQKTDESSTVAP